MNKTLLTIILSSAFSLSLSYGNGSQAMSNSLLKQVIARDISYTQIAIADLTKAITENQGNQRSDDIDKAFTNLVSSWKSVQTAYIIGEVDSDMIDTPRLIDTFHEGNENLYEQIERAVKSNEEPHIALFKNTFKSINALGILLYDDDTLSKIERTYANYILKTLNRHLNDIQKAYATQMDKFSKNEEQFMSYVLNALIDSSYKLKEWRIGEAAGLTKKYEGKPDNRRQEYPLSGNSLVAAMAILNVHDDIMGQRDYTNLGSVAIAQGAEKQVTEIRKMITEAKKKLTELQKEKITDFSDTQIKSFYQTLAKLNDAYYQSLVKALPVQAKILDADGD